MNSIKKIILSLTIFIAGTGQAFADTDPLLRGDANSDTEINIADVGAIISRINYSTYVLHVINADANGDDEINIADVGSVISIINYGMLNGNGTIEGWIEGNEGDELSEHDLEPDEGD
jgi:hypothetical protein